MFKSKKPNIAAVTGVITSKAGLSSLTILIIGIAVAVLLLGGAATATFVGHVGPLADTLGLSKDKADTSTTATAGSGSTDEATKTADAHQAAVQEKQTKITALVSAGDPQSVQQATEIADQQVADAEQTGDDSYIVEANLAKAGIMIENQQNQEAIDTILLPLLQKYQGTDALKYRIDGFLSWAYQGLGNTAKANEYYSQIPVVGENES